MPRTKPKPKPGSKPAVVNGPVGDVLTLAEAAAYLRLSAQDVVAAASTQGLPGRLVAGEWRFSRAAILQWLSVSQPTTEMRKAAMLALLDKGKGKDKDDGGWEELREEIAKYRRYIDAEVNR